MQRFLARIFREGRGIKGLFFRSYGSNQNPFLQEQKHLVVAPSKAVNAGGVSVSELEMAQNAERLYWTAEEVDEKLKGIMKNIYHSSVEVAERYGLGYDLVAGANIVGFQKVADAMMAQGIF